MDSCSVFDTNGEISRCETGQDQAASNGKLEKQLP